MFRFFCKKICFIVLAIMCFCLPTGASASANTSDNASEQALKSFASFQMDLLSVQKDSFGEDIIIPHPAPGQQQQVLLSKLTIQPHMIDKWKIQLSTEIIWVDKGKIANIYLTSDGKMKYQDFVPGHLYVNNPNRIDFAFNPTDQEVVVHTMRIGLTKSLWLQEIKGLPDPKFVIKNISSLEKAEPNQAWKEIYAKAMGDATKNKAS